MLSESSTMITWDTHAKVFNQPSAASAPIAQASIIYTILHHPGKKKVLVPIAENNLEKTLPLNLSTDLPSEVV